MFFAGLVGTVVSGNHPWVKDYYGVPPSTATLPLSSAALVAAKLKAAAWSTLATWALMIVVVPLALVLTGNMEEMTASWQNLLGEQHPLKSAAALVASGIFLFAWTWKRMADSLLLGLTGRKWVIQGTLFVTIFGFCALMAIGGMSYKNPETREVVLPFIPWLLGLWVVCRLLVTGWAVRRLLHQNLVEPRTLRRWLLAWLLLASTLIGTFAWVVPRELVPLHYLTLAIVLVLPMGHLAATPLALAWNRHR